MNRKKLATAIAEAERFIARAKALPVIGKYECNGRTYPHDNFPVEQGAIKRASMDLTRALADLHCGAGTPEGQGQECVTCAALLNSAGEAQLAAKDAELATLRSELSSLRAFQQIPLIDQHGQKVGAENISFADLHKHEVHVDVEGETWTRPTAWAWMMRCKSANAQSEELRNLREAITEALNAPMIDHSQKGRDVFSILRTALARAKEFS